MRITRHAKLATRERILAAAERLFAERGFSATSTRDLAAEAGIAAGTLFNYFRGKEALAVAMFAAALERGRLAFLEAQRGDESLEEALFAHIASGLRELERYRSYAGEVFEGAFSPFQRNDPSDAGAALRERHIEVVEALLRADPAGAAPSPVTVHLYWTLYLGVLAFWSNDDSPKQEDTLAVLDRSVQLFVSSLPRTSQEGRLL